MAATGAVEALATSAEGGAASSLSVTFVLFVLYCAAALQLYGGRPLSVGVRAVLPTGPDQEVGPLGGAYRLAILLMVGGFVAVPLLESVNVSGVAVVLAGYLGVFSVLVSLFLSGPHWRRGRGRSFARGSRRCSQADRVSSASGRSTCGIVNRRGGLAFACY
ncbi:MAG: hypothetical protein ACLUW6_02495 [Coriobacteriaceae bacterium]